MAQEQAVNQRNHDARQVNSEHERSRTFSEERRTEQRIYRKACAATHERHQKQSQEALALVFERARTHERRHRAAETHNHRHESLARKPEETHEAICHKSRTRHVAGIFEERKAKEHEEDDRNERRYRLDTRTDAVRQKRYDNARSANLRQKFRHSVDKDSAEQNVEEIDERAADLHRKPEHQIHGDKEKRNSQDTVQEELIEFVGTGTLVRIVANHLHHDVACIRVA